MSLDIAVVLAYVTIMLLLGWYGFGRTRNSEEFLLAGRTLGPAMYMGTLATIVLGGASTVGTVRMGYVYGISGIWLCVSFGAGLIAISLFLAKPLMNLRIYTITQVLERRYNPAARQASALIMIAYTVMVGVVSMLAAATILQVLLELPFWAALMLGAGCVIVYSVVGGMWSITLTDIVQFGIKTVGLMFLLLPICLYRVGSWDGLTAALPASAFRFGAIGYGTIVTYLLTYTLGFLIGQDIWQRVFTARSVRVARYAGTAAGLYCLLYGVVMAVIGMCARVLLPDLEDPNTAFTAIINLTLPDGIRGLVIAASIASMMSTASATMLAASTTFTEDLLPRLRGGKASGLGVNRLCTALVGAVMLGLSLLENDLIDALLIAYNLLVGGMLVPLVGAVYWARATTAGAIASLGLGCVAVVTLMIRDGAGANTPLYYGLAVSLAAFVIVSLLTRPRDDTPAGGVLHTEPTPQAGATHRAPA